MRARDHMIGQDTGEGGLGLRLDERFDRARRQFGEAASAGARTVNGPLPLRVSTSPAAVTAATSVVNEPAPTAVSTISAIRTSFENPEDRGLLKVTMTL